MRRPVIVEMPLKFATRRQAFVKSPRLVTQAGLALTAIVVSQTVM